MRQPVTRSSEGLHTVHLSPADLNTASVRSFIAQGQAAICLSAMTVLPLLF